MFMAKYFLKKNNLSRVWPKKNGILQYHPSPPFFHVDIKIGSYMGKLALIYYFSACRDFLLCFLIEDFLNGHSLIRYKE